ncbi:hypothetical protein [Sphingomonas bacterium]|uniref:hypothetical protein n=1 Tax=Sphingomonas bacterium TaxID=1895847 RepID=UPI001575D444|nr:hypothetical protein [Sphingomonas bacterium]
MAHNVNLLERAFQLARDGDCRTIAEITKVLKTEDYNGVDAQLQGPSLRGQLRQLCMVARRTQG